MSARYKLANVYRDVAYAVKAGTVSNDPTAIRSAINNHLDGWDKAGFIVNHDYNQPRAVRIVRRLIREL